MPTLRKSMLAAGLAAVLAASGVGVSHGQEVSPAGIPGGPYATAFRVQNLGSNAATCTYQLFSDNGAQAFSSPLPSIQPGESAYIYTPDVSGLASGTYAGVVSCSEPVAAVVNFSETNTGNRGDSYVGTSNPANTLYVPSAYNNYYNYSTSFRIQNASSSANSVTIQYFAPGSSTPVASTTLTIPANGAATVDQSTVSQLQRNVSYSAKVTGSAPLALAVNIFGAVGTSVGSQMYAYSGFTGGATTWYAPVIMRNYYGYNTATTIQNLGSSAANVRLTYSNGTVRNHTIQPNSSQVVLDYNDTTLQRNVLYSSKIESTNGQPLIVSVNESTPTTNRATTYEAFSSGARTQVAPITLKRYFGYNSSVTCQNIGTAATTVNVSYKGTTGSTPVSVNGAAQNIPAGGTALFYQPGENSLPNGFIGSATFTSSASDIVCVTNQDKNEPPAVSTNADLLSAYDTIAK